MGTIFDKWNKSIDVEGLKKDIAEADNGQNNFGDREEIPAGQYECKIDKMELRESKKGDPMFFVQFRILEGQFKNQCMFWNQLLNQGFQISIVNRFLKSLTDSDVEFIDYGQYNNLILDMMEEIDESLEFLIDYKKNRKGFSSFTVKEVYEA